MRHSLFREWGGRAPSVIVELTHPVLGLAQLERDPETALQMNHQLRPIPPHAIESEFLRRALQITGELASELGCQRSGPPRPGPSHQALDPALVGRMNPASQAGARQSQHFGDPGRPLSFQQ